MSNETIFFNSADYFDALLIDINNAKLTIDLETYIFAIDTLGKRILESLIKAAKRGVTVRLLVDGAGTPQWHSKYIRNLEKLGGQTRIFHPFPWRLWQWSRCRVRVPVVLKALYLLLKINSRNHRKTCIIDHQIAYIGSSNICRAHLPKEQQGGGWRDTGIRLTGISFQELINGFNSAWHHLPIHERIKQCFRHIHTNPIIRLNNTRHRRRILYKNLLRRMQNCQTRIWITNAYFVPDNFLLKKLLEAAGRGVDVRILLPKKADVAFMPLASRTFYNKLLKAKIRIFEYLPSMLHAKTLILDNWMTIGSSNLNYRSLLHDLEIDINIRQPSSKELLQQQFLQDLQQAKEVNLNNWHPSFRILGQLLLYLKYLI